MPKLRNMTSENTEDDYSVIITSVCEVGRAADILELVSEWLTSSLVTEASAIPSATKVLSITIVTVFIWLSDKFPLSRMTANN